VARQDILSIVTANAPLRAEALLAPLVELLSEARTTFDGDLDKFLIMLVVAIRAAGHKDFAEAVRQRRAAGGAPVFPSLGVNIQSIADSIGAPKETVRRKVTDLVAAGWIERRGNDLFLTPRAYETHTPLRQAIQELAVRHFEVIGEIVESATARP
jgi:hypothetical protein